MSGELDLASRAVALHACTSVEHLDVIVDLSGLVFMDCAGYGALAASTSILERRGGSMVLLNPVAGPQRLLALIEELELRPCANLRYDTAKVSPAASVPS
jgi:anti-anti-sigma factor